MIYDLKYPVKGREGEYLTVSTTRPETIFGDCAIAINSSDEQSMVRSFFPLKCRNMRAER